MTREQLMIDTFVELADTLASDYDIAEFLHLLVARCQEVLQVDAGGVLVESPDGSLGLAAATSEKMQKFEAAEISNRAGPCIDAYNDVKQVVAENLNDERERWPAATAAALDLGMQAVYAFPLRLRDTCIGALNLYRGQPGAFGEDDVRLAQAFADAAAIGILQHRQVLQAEARSEQLQGALTSRAVIEQAKGVVMAKTGMSGSEAFELLRKQSRDNRVKLSEVAAGVVRSQSADAAN